ITSSTGQPPPNDGFRPYGIWVTAAGDVLVTDLSHTRVLRFRQSAAPPTLGKTVSVAAVRGKVLVKLPPGTSAPAAQTKGNGFVPLTQARLIPVGSQLDVRRGTVRLTTAANDRGGTQSGEFTAGIFQVLQTRKSPGLSNLRLTGK